MNNNVLLSVAMSIIPMLAIGFVVLLIIYKVYIKIRSRFNTNVNCWFCNQNTKVPYLNANSWTCPSCEQYNGFDKDGGYNREIFEQLDCSNTSSVSQFNISDRMSYSGGMVKPSQNGFCDGCNEAQRLKVEKLAQFEPKNESHFDEELAVFKSQLEQQYRLCTTCDRHLNRVLREKKKMVLGSKFLDFIIKGAENLKQPHLNLIQHAQQQLKKKKLRTLIVTFTLINIVCIMGTVSPTLNREHFTNVLGDVMGRQLFMLTSHFMAFIKVISTYLSQIKQYEIIVKLSLFLRTISMMCLYSMGLKVTNFTFYGFYTSFYPFAILFLAFIHNIVDSFRLTRYTFMMALWSLFAGQLIDQEWTLSPQVLMLLSSLATFLMALGSKPDPSPKLHDNTADSFHKLYSEDYLSDDDTMSMLSQQLNGSSVSMRSIRSQKSFRLPNSPLSRTAYSTAKSPARTSSVFSLHQMSNAQPGGMQSQISPNASFRSYNGDAGNHQTSRSVFATPMTVGAGSINSMRNRQTGLFASNLELHTQPRPSVSLFGGGGGGMNGSLANSTMFNQSFVEPSSASVVLGNNSRYSNETQHNDSYLTANNTVISNKNATLRGNQTFIVAASTHSGMHSPFSISSNAVFHNGQQQQAMGSRQLLSPTRFSTNCLTTAVNNHNSSNASWLSGGYFNQRQSMSEIPLNGLLMHSANNGLTSAGPMTSLDENLSRASSHSSGFESQNGGAAGGRLHNRSRESSMCPDIDQQQTVDYNQRTLTSDNLLHTHFQPIDSPRLSTFSPRPSVLSQPALNTNTHFAPNSDIWKQPSNTLSRRLQSAFTKSTNFDSFNLKRINEELPTIKKNELLQKWKEGQIVS